MKIEIEQKEGFKRVIVDDESFKRFSKTHWEQVGFTGEWERIPMPMFCEMGYQQRLKGKHK